MFVCDPESKINYMKNIFNERLNSAIAAGIPIDPSYSRRISNAYASMHQVLDSCYLPQPAKKTISTIRQSNAWLKGFEHITNPSHREIYKDLTDLVKRNPDGILNAQEVANNEQLICRAILMALQDIEKITGGQFLVWRVYPMVTHSSTSSYSNSWHYDVHIQQDHPYSMYYLEADISGGGGTYFLPAPQSESLSNRTGYISSPITERITELKEVDPEYDTSYVEYIRASSCKAVVFWPSRVLHKGELPASKNPRVVLHFSFLPVTQADTIEQRVKSSFDLCRFQFNEQSSALPFYLQTPNVYDSLAYWDGRIAGDIQADLLIKSIFPKGTNLPLRSYGPNKDINGLIGDIADIIQANGADRERKDLQIYIDSVNKDKNRYYAFPKQHTYWPNADHPKYPTSIYELKPYTKSYPFISQTTRIGSAGSCFAVEISEHFQKRGFNYMITERPKSISDGVQVDGYFPGTSNFVRFSANYGIHFNSLSLLQLAQRAFSEKTFKKLLISDDSFPGWLQDPYRELVIFRSTRDYIEDYPLHTLAIRNLLTDVEAFIFTMGLNECWRFRDDHSAISRNPRSQHLYPLIYHSTLMIEDHIEAIGNFYELVKAHNPNFKLILSLSPIAFLATGRAETHHVITANCHSKAVQRVAAEILSEKYDDIYYFPSYEYVSFCLKDPWKPDGRHLKEESIKKVMEFFEEMFVTD